MPSESPFKFRLGVVCVCVCQYSAKELRPRGGQSPRSHAGTPCYCQLRTSSEAQRTGRLRLGRPSPRPGGAAAAGRRLAGCRPDGRPASATGSLSLRLSLRA